MSDKKWLEVIIWPTCLSLTKFFWNVRVKFALFEFSSTAGVKPTKNAKQTDRRPIECSYHRLLKWQRTRPAAHMTPPTRCASTTLPSTRCTISGHGPPSRPATATVATRNRHPTPAQTPAIHRARKQTAANAARESLVVAVSPAAAAMTTRRTTTGLDILLLRKLYRSKFSDNCRRSKPCVFAFYFNRPFRGCIFRTARMKLGRGGTRQMKKIKQN